MWHRDTTILIVLPKNVILFVLINVNAVKSDSEMSQVLLRNCMTFS